MSNISFNKIIKYKGGFSIRRILDTKNSRFRQVLIAFHPLFSHLPSCVNSARHNTRINKKIIKNDDQKTVEYEVECTKARQMMYVHKKEVYHFGQNFQKFSKLSYTFLLCSKISPVTLHFYTCVKFAHIYRFVTHLFDANLTDPDARESKNEISSQFHPFANPSL